MALNLANVELSDTFNTWRVRTNSVIGEAVSGTSTTSQTVTANTTFSGNITVNGVVGADLSFNDNTKAVFGTGSDLEIYHDASNSLINDAGTGNIKIQTGGTDRVEVTAGGGSLYGTWTVTEGLTVDGPAVFNGNTTIVQSTVIETTDGLIHLASNNEVSDTLDIGFFGHYFNGSANQHAGVIRDSGTKEFYIFNEYSPGFEPENDINIDDGSFALANVHAAFFKGDGSQLTNAGSTVATQSGGPDTELRVAFTGITSGTMTSANVNPNFTFNPSSGALSANTFVGDGSQLTGITAGATVATGTNNADLFIPFTGINTGTLTTANVNSSFTFNPSTGQANATDFNSTSDARLKINVEPITGAVDKVMALEGVYFDWIETGVKSMGLIAQQVEESVPEVVSTDNRGFKSISYGKLIGLLIEAIKEQQDTINKLKD